MNTQPWCGKLAQAAVIATGMAAIYVVLFALLFKLAETCIFYGIVDFVYQMAQQP